MATYFFASPVDVDVKLEDEDARKKVDIKGEKERIISCPVYYDGESIAGQVRIPQLQHPEDIAHVRLHVHPFLDYLTIQVTVRVRDGKRMTHDGIKVEFVGNIGAWRICFD